MQQGGDLNKSEVIDVLVLFSRPSLAFARPAHPCAMESHTSQFTRLFK